MVAGKDHCLLLDLAPLFGTLFLDLQMEEPGKKVEKTIALEDLFPQLCRSVGTPFGIEGITSATVAPLVEGEKMRRRASQPGGHEHRLGIHCEMDQGPPLELEDLLTGIAVLAILAFCVIRRLSGDRVFEFRRSDGDAIQTESDVEGLLRAGRKMQLPRDSKPVSFVTLFQFRIELMGRFEEGHPQGPAVTFEAMAQGGQGTIGVHPLA